VRHHHNRDATCCSDRLPSFFTVDYAIENCYRIRIFENEGRRLKVDAVLPKISPVLSLIPINSRVVTIL